MIEQFLTVEELCQKLKVKPSTVYGWGSQNFIPRYKIGRSVRFRESEVLKWLETKRQSGRPNRIPSIELKTGRIQK